MSRPGNPDEVAAAYARTESDLRALPKDQVGRVTADIPNAVSIVLGALPHVESLIDEMKRELTSPPLVAITRLRERALAALYAHLHYAPATTKLDAELEEARRLREVLLATADAHVKHGDFEAESVARIRDGSGNLDRANDCIALSALFQVHWSEIEGRTQATQEQLSRATVLGTGLVRALGEKALGTGTATGGRVWADDRARAFRLLVNDYDAVRRAVEYVRFHEGDATSFTPTLHQRRRGSGAADDAGGGEPGGDGDARDPTTPGSSI